MPQTVSATHTWIARLRPTFSPEALAGLAALVLALGYNIRFWDIALNGRDLFAVSDWMFTAGTFVLLAALQWLALLIFGISGLLRPLLVLSFVTAAAAQFFTLRYGVVADTDMLRNALHTNTAEASEYLGWGLLAWMLAFALLPAILVLLVRIRRVSWRRALLRRLTTIGVVLCIAVLAAWAVYQDLSSLTRNQSELRFAVNPFSPLLSAGKAWRREHHQQALTRAPSDPAWRKLTAAAHKPLLLVLVVGETARAANFSLLGYERPTNPELAREDLIAFRDMQACGTATEVSLPCMFSSYGRASYDENAIRSHDSLLHVLRHAGVQVNWLDNQSGCKGVCDGLPYEEVQRHAAPELCNQGECRDEALLTALDRLTLKASEDHVVVMHQLGNHGPAYHRRYPPAFERFRPACRSDELRDCTRQEIVNAYDNAILYTDHVLAGVLARLRALQAERDVAMVYVSDHGESLGEHGLYLHGTPYFMAPDEQLRVAMLWWLPEETARHVGVNGDCMKRRATGAASHDHLYHTLLGLLSVRTASYLPARDLTVACRDGHVS